MSPQPDMFHSPRRRVETPAARRTDPHTSHEAAEVHTASGKRAQQQHQAASSVREFPGMTSLELSRWSGLDRYMLARRLPECVTAGLVRKGDAKRCRLSGRQALTWWPA